MRNLTSDDFAGRTGTAYDVTFDEAAVPLMLDQVELLPDAGREGGSFRLIFSGPADPVLPQAIYPFRSGEEAVEIFIVPIARDDKATRYEAVFF